MGFEENPADQEEVASSSQTLNQQNFQTVMS